MRTPGRVILVAGQGGAGTTSLARSAVDSIRSEGVDVQAIDASGAQAVEPDPSITGWLGSTLGRLWQEAGADPVVPEAWSGLPDVGIVDAWRRIVQARQECDAVVVDAGSLSRVRDLCVLPGSLAHLLDAALTPRMAMWRSVSGAGGLFESLSDLRVAARTWLGVLQHDDTSLRLVGRPDRDAVDDLLRASALMSMLGVDVDGIVVNRVPRKDRKGPDARAMRTAALATVAALEEGGDGVCVWRATASADDLPVVRPAPKGTSVLARLSEGAVPPARSRTMALSSDDDGYLLAVPLRQAARRGAQVGVQDGRIVLRLDGVHAWHELPSVLHRCEAVRAERTSEAIVIRWSPDVDVWPRGPADASEAGASEAGAPQAGAPEPGEVR